MSPYSILAITALYFVILFVVSYLAGRKADNAGFFVGNRESKWYHVAIAMIGSGISGVTFVSVPGMVAGSGFSYLQMVLGFVVGQVIIAFVLLPLFYRQRLFSIYEYLNNRFGMASYKTGAWFFFISKMLGASVRIYLVVLTMQLLVFDPLGLPFILNVVVTIGLVWLYTFLGGVKSLISTDMLKTFCLVFSLILSIYFISEALGLGWNGLFKRVSDSSMSRVFFFDDINDRRYFWKLFLAGVFTVIATTGLDQDMMQRNLSCKNDRESRKNMLVSSVFQFFVISLFLFLGALLYIFADTKGIALPSKGDEVFPFLATGGYFPVVVGVLFILGLVAAAYSAAGSALTALTTSFTIDILGAKEEREKKLMHTRRKVHVGMAVLMGLCIVGFKLINNTSVIDACYILSSYTYGPILGLFVFGMTVKRPVRDRWIPIVAILSPILCYIIDTHSEAWFGGYKFSYEILLLNAFFTYVGCLIAIKPGKRLPEQTAKTTN